MTERNFWIVRVGDGENLRNSRFPFWGIKAGKNNVIKGMAKNIVAGDVLVFISSKPFGGKVVGLAEFVELFDIERSGAAEP